VHPSVEFIFQQHNSTPLHIGIVYITRTSTMQPNPSN